MNDDKQAVHNLRRPLKKAAAVLAAAVLLLSSGCNKAQPETELFSLLLEKQEQEQRQEQEERQGENVILLTHSATAFSTTQKIAGRFKMALEEKSGGRFRVEIFPDDTLGHVNDSDRPLLNQTVEMRIGPAATDTMGAMLWASTLSDASLEEIDKLLKDGEARRMLEEECEAKGIKLLAVFPAHYCVLTGNERIDEAEDFSKLEMRIFTSNTTEGAYWQSLGAQTRVYDIHQVFSALQQGLVNSQENTLPLIVSNSIHRLQKYLILTNHKIYFECMLVGMDFYDSLSEEEQKLLTETAQEMVDYAREMDERELEACTEVLSESGVETVELPDEVLRRMRETGGPVVEAALRAEAGDEKIDRLLTALRGE